MNKDLFRQDALPFVEDDAGRAAAAYLGEAGDSGDAGDLADAADLVELRESLLMVSKRLRQISLQLRPVPSQSA